MTEQRAAEVLNVAVTFNGSGRATSDELKEALVVADNALKKQTPVDPVSRQHQWHVDHYCPVCGKQQKAPSVLQFKKGSYCGRCGQKIKWGDCSD